METIRIFFGYFSVNFHDAAAVVAAAAVVVEMKRKRLMSRV